MRIQSFFMINDIPSNEKIDLDRIFIFKTDIDTHDAYHRLSEFLNELDDVIRWNLDMQDCDHVLRIETKSKSIDFYLNSINTLNILCEELPD